MVRTDDNACQCRSLSECMITCTLEEVLPPYSRPLPMIADSYLYVSDVNWGTVTLHERAGRFAWYSHKGGARRQSGYFVSAVEAAAYTTRKGMTPMIMTTFL